MDTLQAAFETACGKFNGSNLDSLSEPDRVLVTIWGLEAEVNNGGVDQYYLNGAGDQAFFAPVALSLIGANQMAAIVKEANAAFGAAGPPPDWQLRRERLLGLTGREAGLWDRLDGEFYEYPDDIAALLTAYLRAHGLDV